MDTLQRKALGLEIELLVIPRNQILGPEKGTSDFLSKAGFIPDLDLIQDAWDQETASYLFLWHSLVVVKRKAGFVYLGSGRMLRLAEEIPGREFALPAILIKNKLSRKTKLKLLAAELFGIHALAKTRRHLPNRMFELWKQFRDEGIETILGELPSDFALGSGYSLKAVNGVSIRTLGSAPPTSVLSIRDADSGRTEGEAQ